MLRAGDVLKAQEENFPALGDGVVLKAFPDLKVGDVVKVYADDVHDFEIGDFMLIQRTGDDQDLTLLHVDETQAVSSTPDEVGTRISSIEEAAVTVEILSATAEGGRQ